MITNRLKIYFLSLLCAILFINPTEKALAEVAPTTDVPFASTQRISGADRYETAAKIVEAGWKTSSDFAVIAAGMDENIVDALTVAPLAKLKKAPILLTEGSHLNSWAESELNRLQVKQVYVTSGPGVIQKAVTDRLVNLGIRVIPLGGADRFETSVNIASEINNIKPFSEIVLTTAWTNADALSIAPIAADQGIPILLADVNSLPASVTDYLDGIRPTIKKSYILGSESVLTEKVLTSVPNGERIAGPDRFGTNLEILKTFQHDLKYGKIYLANGEDEHLVDALAISSLAALDQVPLVLTSATIPGETRSYVKAYLAPREIILLGGEAVVPIDSLSDLTSGLGISHGSIAGKNENEKNLIPDNLDITGSDVTLENCIAAFSLNVRGNNVTLRNVNVLGTLILDPGQNGTANLENVYAPNIVILSGATESIHLNDVTTDSLKVDSSSTVRIVSTGKTSITDTYLLSPTILDEVSGDFGSVKIAQLSGSEEVVELNGTFEQPVIVTGQATILTGLDSLVNNLVISPREREQKVILQGPFGKVEVAKSGSSDLVVELRGKFDQPIAVCGQATLIAADNATIAKVEILPENNLHKITLKGNFLSVDVNKEAKLDIADNSTVAKLITNAKTSLTVPPTSSIISFDAKQTGTVPSGGGKVNDKVSDVSTQIPEEDGTNIGGNVTNPTDIDNTVQQGDKEAVDSAIARLTETTILDENSGLSNITENLILPTSGLENTTIEWISSAVGTITTSGKVIRPTSSVGDVKVTLTASISKGAENKQKTFVVTVKKMTVKDIINSMSLNIVGSFSKIELAISEKECSANFDDAQDDDYVKDVTINVSRDVVLRTRVLKLVETPLSTGNNTLQLEDLIGRDLGSNIAYISMIELYGGIYVNGWLVDPDSKKVISPVTLSVK